MKIAILGAGITGLTTAQLLKNNHDVTIFEKNNYCGGIAHVKMIENIPYHTVGGHCFNSKYQQVMDYVFNNVLDKTQWNSVKRNAKIFFHENLIGYPIEFSIKQIAEFDEKLAFQITKDFFNAHDKNSKNLDEFFRNKFGNILAEEYFIPYNKKIWGKNPKNIDPIWVADKLPIPNLEQFFRGLIKNEKDTMPHATFYYPVSNSQNTLIDNLAKGLYILLNNEISSIKYKNKKWILNNNYECDQIISTIPLDTLILKVLDSPKEPKYLARKLKFNRISNVLWESESVESTWTYHPSQESLFHRHIHIGNFIKPNRNYTITEAVGVYSFEEMVEAGKKFKYLIKPIDFNVSDHAYVVYDKNYSKSVNGIKAYLKEIGIESIGRFGEWEYYNMDLCMLSAINLAKKINDQLNQNL